jgi:Zn-dependent M28 family amino/carboxypeptidase
MLVGDLKVKTTTSGIGSSDHTSFYLQDVPAIHFFTGTHALPQAQRRRGEDQLRRHAAHHALHRVADDHARTTMASSPSPRPRR